MNARNLAAAAALLLALPALAQSARPDFLSQGEPAASHSGHVRSAGFARTRDGTRLAVTWYLPGAGTGRHPALLWYHPGHRESIDPRSGAIRPTMSAPDIAFFTAHGYAVAIAEMRGSGASFGARELDRGPQIGRDGKDVVDWIPAQSWSDGKVGMIGASYQGFAQYAVAAERPAALKAIFPEIAGFDDYTSMFFPGGIPASALSDSASGSIERDDLNVFIPDGPRQHYPSVPVIDEDGDGELLDEIPIDGDGDGSFLNDGPPRYTDGKLRADIYYRATLEHRANRHLPVEKLIAAPHRDSLIDGTAYRWADLDPGAKPERIAASGIAVYSRGGWFDYHARDTLMWQATLAGKVPSFAMMAPVGHGGLPMESGGEAIYRAGPYLALLGDTRSTNGRMNIEKLAFFDRYVKGLPNGFERRPPLLLYVMNGEGWRYENEWPLARARSWKLWLAADGVLRDRPAPAARQNYGVELSASSLSNGANRWNFGISRAHEPMRLAANTGQRLAYTTVALNADTEVTGHPLVQLALGSDAADGDVFAYLEDVAPDGSALLVTEGQLRANYWRRTGNGPSPISKPILPWHGFGKVDYLPRPFAERPGLRLRFDMLPTAWVFKRGHRIRLSFAGADWPTFRLHPGLSPTNDPAASNTVRSTWTIWRGPGVPELTLPVVPPRK
jgi:uncharacterized protein